MRCRSYLLIAGILAAFALMSGGAYALSVSDGTFSPQQGVRQGETYSTDVLVRNSPDKSNHFLMTVGGDVRGWVTNINPSEFNLSAGGTRLVALTILVPLNATRGMHSGTATATGTQIIGSGIGYQEAARGNIWAEVVSDPAGGSGGSVTPPDNSTNSTNSTQGGSGSDINPGNNTAANNTITPPTDPISCTADLMVCPDGSYVSRNSSANCTFIPCPNVSITPIVNNTPAAPAPNPPAVSVVSPSSSNSGGGGPSSVSSGASGGGTAPVSRINSSSGAANQARATPPVQDRNNTLPVPGSAEPVIASPAFMRAAPVLRVIDETKGVLETQTASVEYTGRLEVKESNIFMDTSAGLKQILLLPEDAIKASETPGKEDVKKVELKEESQKPVYSVTRTKKAKFLYILPVSIDVETNIDAENGNVVSVNKPWWSFLAFD